MITTGVLAPTAAASKPSVIVSVYAGATDEIPSMVPPKRPTTLLFKPLSAISVTLLELCLRDADQPSKPWYCITCLIRVYSSSAYEERSLP